MLPTGCWTLSVPSVSQLLGSQSGSGVQHSDVPGDTLMFKTKGCLSEPRGQCCTIQLAVTDLLSRDAF